MRPHAIMFCAFGLLLLSALLLGSAAQFERASGSFIFAVVVGLLGWAMLLSERRIAARRAAEEAKGQAHKATAWWLRLPRQ